ncbi:MAG: tetratricopeptide repeat protein, partial [Limisphaerales bacterium]
MNPVTQRPKAKFSTPARENTVWWLGIIGAVAVMLLYLPTFRAGFIWDDDVMLTDNPLVKGGWRGLLNIWCSTKLVDYFPLTSTSLWLEWHLWGTSPAGYHVTNIVLHAISALLLWRVLLALKIPGAWLAAALFAVHPVCVASVAWIAERKNTLSMVFYLLSILWFLRFEETGRKKLYWFSLGAFVLALVSKTSVVILPFVLLLCVWWKNQRVTRHDNVRAAPFFGLALLFGFVTVWFQLYRGIGALNIPNADSFYIRLIGGSWAVWFYLLHAVFPVGLTMIYPRWPIDPSSLITYVPFVFLLLLLGFLWKFRRSWGRPCLFALGYSIITLLPVLGFFNMGFLAYSRAADHWQYLSVIGPVALMAATVSSTIFA